MNLDKIYKNLVLTNISLLISIFVYEIFYLPKEIVNLTNLDDISTTSIFIMFAIVLLNFVALILIYKFKKIGKNLYASSIILLLLTSFYSYILAFDPILYILDHLHSITGGAIIIIIYFTTIKNKFR